jgi:hypothetical protein
MRVTVIAADGTVLADSRAVADSMENHGGRAEVRAALAGGVGVATRRSATVGVEFLYVAVPMSRDGAAVLRLAEPLEILRKGRRVADAALGRGRLHRRAGQRAGAVLRQRAIRAEIAAAPGRGPPHRRGRGRCARPRGPGG